MEIACIPFKNLDISSRVLFKHYSGETAASKDIQWVYNGSDQKVIVNSTF